MGKLKINYDAENDKLIIGDLILNNEAVSLLEDLQDVSHNVNKSITKAIITAALESPEEDPLFKDELDRQSFFINLKILLDLTDSLWENLPYEKQKSSI